MSSQFEGRKEETKHKPCPFCGGLVYRVDGAELGTLIVEHSKECFLYRDGGYECLSEISELRSSVHRWDTRSKP